MKQIIAINKTKIIATEINPNSKNVAGASYEFGWKQETLDMVFAEIEKKLKNKTVRILVSDDLSYVVRVKVPTDVGIDKERSFILSQISQKIPEKLTDSQWDYKEISSSRDKQKQASEKDVLVFALVTNFYNSLVPAIEKTNLKVEAIEPETISKSRNANPLVGLALKEDVSGRDEDVLNLRLEVSESEVEKIPEEIEQEIEKVHKSIKSKNVVIIVLILLIVSLLGGGFYFYKFKLGKNTQTQPKPVTPTQAENKSEETLPTDTPTPTPASESANLSTFKLQVQNGSGVAGEAGSVSDTLSFEGFENIDTTNADNSDYTKTEVRMKNDIPQSVYEVIDKALNSDYEMSLASDKLESSNEFDIIIVVGKRLTSS